MSIQAEVRSVSSGMRWDNLRLMTAFDFKLCGFICCGSVTHCILLWADFIRPDLYSDATDVSASHTKLNKKNCWCDSDIHHFTRLVFKRESFLIVILLDVRWSSDRPSSSGCVVSSCMSCFLSQESSVYLWRSQTWPAALIPEVRLTWVQFILLSCT